MKTRIILGLVIVALVIPSSGCPSTTPEISLGVWLFSVVGFAEVAVEFGTDGMAQPPNPLPPEANGFFVGATSWTQDGSTFMFTIVFGTETFVYSGTVESSTTIIDGTWTQTVGGTQSGTWSGMKL